MNNVRVVPLENMEEAKREMKKIGTDTPGMGIMAPKAVHRVIKVEEVRTVAANLLKQEMLAKGGEAALTRGAANFSVDHTDVLLMATVKQYREVIKKLKMQDFGLAKLAEQISQVLDNLEAKKPYIIDCRGKNLTIGERTLVMGILNVTPDSFSDGGKFFKVDDAVAHAHQMVEEGADLIDAGAISTRPGFEEISQEEEIERLLPVLEILIKEIDVPISVDTYRAKVARKALDAGAHMINDQWALKADPDLAKVCAEYNVPVFLMHNQKDTEYKNLMEEMLASLQESIDIGLAAGIKKENLIIDPGIGLGKDLEQSLECMKRLREFKTLGYPLLLATSRKSMIGKTLDLPVDQRVEGTAATVALGIAYGADMVRVHDVKEMVRVCRMTDAMVRR